MWLHSMLFDQLLVKAVLFKNPRKKRLVYLCRFLVTTLGYGGSLFKPLFLEIPCLTDQGVRNKFLLPIRLIKTLMMAKVVDSFEMLRVKLVTVFTGSQLIWRHVSLVPKKSAYELMMSLPSWKRMITPRKNMEKLTLLPENGWLEDIICL